MWGAQLAGRCWSSDVPLLPPCVQFHELHTALGGDFRAGAMAAASRKKC